MSHPLPSKQGRLAKTELVLGFGLGHLAWVLVLCFGLGLDLLNLTPACGECSGARQQKCSHFVLDIVGAFGEIRRSRSVGGKLRPAVKTAGLCCWTGAANQAASSPAQSDRGSSRFKVRRARPPFPSRHLVPERGTHARAPIPIPRVNLQTAANRASPRRRTVLAGHDARHRPLSVMSVIGAPGALHPRQTDAAVDHQRRAHHVIARA